MKNLATTLSLLGLAAALPAPQAEDPVRTLPPNWAFKITGLRGPGCPDFGAVDGADNKRATRLTYGQNTVDGTEIYRRFIAYPSMRVELGKTESVWCETDLEYVEYDSFENNAGESSKYRLRLHKDGTHVIWTADLEQGAKATLSFTYLDSAQTDTVTINGPAKYDHQGVALTGPGGPAKVATCGATKLKFRTELTISGTGKGVVHSLNSMNADGSPQYYGTQIGFSYDWEKC